MNVAVKIFNKKLIFIIFVFILIELIPVFLGSGDILLGYHSNTDYLPDPTGRFTLHTIKSRYVYVNIPISWSSSYNGRITVSNRFSFGRFYDPSFITGGLVKNSNCFSQKTYDSYRRTDGIIEKIKECVGFGVVEITNAPPIIN